MLKMSDKAMTKMSNMKIGSDSKHKAYMYLTFSAGIRDIIQTTVSM